MASTQREARSDISTYRSSYFSLARRTLLDGGARAHSRARHEVVNVIGREIKKREK